METSQIKNEASESRNESMFMSLGRVSAFDAVVERIEGLIIGRQFLPGEPLPSERDLADGMGVGRNVIREALRVLAEKRLVEIVAGRGTYVIEPDTSSVSGPLQLLMRRGNVSLKDLGDARYLIEPEVAAIAARNASDENTRELLDCVRRLDAAVTDVEEHVKADADLHREIAKIAGQPVFQFIIEAIHEAMMWSMRLATTFPGAIANADDRHRKIVAAIVAGNPEMARFEMQAHMTIVADYALQNQEVVREWTLGDKDGPS